MQKRAAVCQCSIKGVFINSSGNDRGGVLTSYLTPYINLSSGRFPLRLMENWEVQRIGLYLAMHEAKVLSFREFRRRMKELRR